MAEDKATEDQAAAEATEEEEDPRSGLSVTTADIMKGTAIRVGDGGSITVNAKATAKDMGRGRRSRRTS